MSGSFCLFHKKMFCKQGQGGIAIYIYFSRFFLQSKLNFLDNWILVVNFRLRVLHQAWVRRMKSLWPSLEGYMNNGKSSTHTLARCNKSYHDLIFLMWFHRINLSDLHCGIVTVKSLCFTEWVNFFHCKWSEWLVVDFKRNNGDFFFVGV